MGKLGKIILSAFFLIMIFLFGSTTVLKAKGDILSSMKTNTLSDIPNAIDASMTENFKSRNNWININGLFQRLAGVTIIRDAGDIDVYKMNNGQLTYYYPDNDMTYAAKETIGLAEFVGETGADFMYVQLPCKAYSDELMPAGTHTYGYADADELIAALKEKDVPVLDLRKRIADEDSNISELYFNTDHQWKPSTGLWAAREIAQELSKTVHGYEYDKSLLDEDNYEKRTYKDWFLGSLGRRTGRFFGGVDDFETIIPKFESNFKLYTESQTDGKVRKREGSFEKALMRMDYLEEKDMSILTPGTIEYSCIADKLEPRSGDNAGYYTYQYMGNEYRLSSISNLSSDNNKKILMLRDSFSCVVQPFLSFTTSEITAIDMRYHSKLNLKEYIKNNDYDAVIIVYNPSMFREERAFDFD